MKRGGGSAATTGGAGRVTGVEQPFPTDTLLVTKTDPRGVITYASRSFCLLTGYCEAELIGQPHSIVRHPDMPASFFAGMWQTIQSGREWSGCIKNRCKNGDHCWMHTWITSEQDEQGRIIGVRRTTTSQGKASCDCEEALRKGTL
ncbi:MAG: PAS domain-containing protein [Zetaproteobacteria bacterium]|nr:MAG: PAS domain-containing protein [Zetaproteobacteria bacterium]